VAGVVHEAEIVLGRSVSLLSKRSIQLRRSGVVTPLNPIIKTKLKRIALNILGLAFLIFTHTQVASKKCHKRHCAKSKASGKTRPAKRQKFPQG
jgi:hypothetical protein